MDKAVTFAALVLWGVLFALANSQELENPNGGIENGRKRGGCPEGAQQDLVSSKCSDLCENKDNCTIQTIETCVDDFNCEGSLKCCKTRCGTECLLPIFRSPCQNNFDCPWTLKCCGGVCDSDCVYQPRNMKPKN
ncbi:uncharacterized protein RB166_019160 [Leptodactylus fuscus]